MVSLCQLLVGSAVRIFPAFLKSVFYFAECCFDIILFFFLRSFIARNGVGCGFNIGENSRSCGIETVCDILKRLCSGILRGFYLIVEPVRRGVDVGCDGCCFSFFGKRGSFRGVVFLGRAEGFFFLFCGLR